MSHTDDLRQQIEMIRIRRDDLALDLENQDSEIVIREMKLELMTLDSDIELLERVLRQEVRERIS